MNIELKKAATCTIGALAGRAIPAIQNYANEITEYGNTLIGIRNIGESIPWRNVDMTANWLKWSLGTDPLATPVEALDGITRNLGELAIYGLCISQIDLGMQLASRAVAKVPGKIGKFEEAHSSYLKRPDQSLTATQVGLRSAIDVAAGTFLFSWLSYGHMIAPAIEHYLG